MKKFFKRHTIVFFILLIIAVSSLVIGTYYYFQYQKSQELLKNPTLRSQKEVKAVIDNVARLIELPTEEQPTIATVSDITKLKDQAFFAHAKNGDKVLIFTKARKAILYDPVADKIVEVSTINLGQTIPQNRSATPLGSLKIALYNGTSAVGFTMAIQKELASKAPRIQIIAKANASSTNYTQTLIIDLTGKNAQAASQLAALLTGIVAPLPQGEVKPDQADILVILGKNSVVISPTISPTK